MVGPVVRISPTDVEIYDPELYHSYVEPTDTLTVFSPKVVSTAKRHHTSKTQDTTTACPLAGPQQSC